VGSRYLVVLVSNHGVRCRQIIGNGGGGLQSLAPLRCLPLILVLSHLNWPLRVKWAQPSGGLKDKPHTHDQSKWARTSMGPKATCWVTPPKPRWANDINAFPTSV